MATTMQTTRAHPEHAWIDDYSSVTEFGRHLVDDALFTADELQAYYEKPWKWSAERAEWVANGRKPIDDCEDPE